MVTGSGTRKIDLPPASEIESAVRDYRAMIDNSLADPLARAGTAGDRLYQLLIAPAAIPHGASVVVVADGALHGLNFETLPVDGPRRHYWIEDAEVQVAPSLSLLTAARPRPKRQHEELLLIGNPTPRAPEFPALSYAPAEMTSIVRHFPQGQVTSYDGEHASPAVYRKRHTRPVRDDPFHRARDGQRREPARFGGRALGARQCATSCTHAMSPRRRCAPIW